MGLWPSSWNRKSKKSFEDRRKDSFKLKLFLLLFIPIWIYFDDPVQSYFESLSLPGLIASATALLLLGVGPWLLAFHTTFAEWLGRFMTPHGRDHYLGGPRLEAVEGGAQDEGGRQ